MYLLLFSPIFQMNLTTKFVMSLDIAFYRKKKKISPVKSAVTCSSEMGILSNSIKISYTNNSYSSLLRYFARFPFSSKLS